jgi:hypothetical protein
VLETKSRRIAPRRSTQARESLGAARRGLQDLCFVTQLTLATKEV